MKGQANRFVSRKGLAYDVHLHIKKPVDDNIGFFDLWRYATPCERVSSACGAALAWVASLGLVGAVVVYGELTSLFVQRHNALPTASYAHILALFGGGESMPAGDRDAHMTALEHDSRAFIIASLIIMAVQFLAAASAVALVNWTAHNMVNRLRLRLLRSVISQEMAFFDTSKDMNFATTLTEDMEKLRGGVGEHVAMTSYLAGTVVCGVGLAFSYGWQLTLAGLAVVPLSIIVAAVVAKKQTRWSGEEVQAYGAAGRVVEAALSAVRTVRAFGGEREEARRYRAALGAARRATRARGLWAAAGTGLGWLLTYTLNAVVFTYGAMLIVRDRSLLTDEQQYHPGIMVTILFCTFMAAQNITMCHPHLDMFSTARGAAKSIFSLLEKKSRIDALEDRGHKPPSFKGDIVFDNIHFNYPARPDVKILRGLSLQVNAGETVALVGGSGCGKSTLLQLVQRLYEPDAGTVFIDGHRLNELNLHHFRTSIGVVGQEPVLFSGTIRDNITLGMGAVSDADLIAAAKTAHAHQFITKLPQGYETALGERGASLSGGQKQRLAIARAVLRRPALLLLDEPTSALDPAAERQVQAALDSASVGRTTLVVSHRLSTIVNATRIVVLDKGCVAEQGTHAELVARRGMYWQLVQADLTTKSIVTNAAANNEDNVNGNQDGNIDNQNNDLDNDQGPDRIRNQDNNNAIEHESADVGDDDDLPDLQQHFQRSSTQHSTNFIRASSSMSGALRGSRRMVPVPPPPDNIPHVDTDEKEEDVANVSSWQLMRLQAPEWPLLLGGGLASVAVGAVMPTFAYLFSKLFGMFSWPEDDEILYWSGVYGGLFAGVACVCGLVTFLQTWLLTEAGARLTRRLRDLTFTAFLRQEQAWFDSASNSVGALCARLAGDCAAVQGATGTRLGTMLQGVSTMTLGVALAMVYSWKMTLVSLLSVPCVIGGIYLEGYVNKKSEEQERRALEQASRVATEATLNVRTVQSLGVESEMLSRYAAALASGGARRTRHVRGPVYGLCLCAPTLGYTVSLAYGGYLIAREDLHYEYAILVSEALIYGAWMLAEALSFAPNFAAARRSGARIVAALAKKPLILTEPTAEHIPDWRASGEVSYDKVAFSYPGREGASILRGLSLRIEAGRTLALVGPSGCGKSTLVHLLLRNYDPASGHVALDGRDVRRDLTLEQLRAQLGLVQQEPVLFERSLRDNIAYGDLTREVPIDQIIRAAKMANVHDFIAGLPQGYDTVVGGSASLSGGQKQRVAIARALVREPRVLLLDEATSALDASSERAVQAALDVAAQGRTTIVIAHRLATVQNAHRICVIDKGVVAESGSHEELVAARGLYWALLQQQAHHAH